MLFSSRNHAIGMAHYQIAGGLKSLLFLLGGYLAIIGLVIGMLVYNQPRVDIPQAVMAMATLLLVLEGFGLVMMGAVRVAGCIRTDIMTNMIESHRQMPISAARALLGYLFGTTIHIVAVIALNVMVLALLVGLANVGFEAFVLSQIVLAAFALFVWTFAAMGSFMFRQAMPLMVLVFIFSGCGSTLLRGWGLLPGVSLLAAPFLGETIFTFARGMGRMGGISMYPAYSTALVAQAALGALFFIGACRRYRGAYLTTFNVPMGVALVAVWSMLSVFAIQIWPSLTSIFRRDFPQQPSIHAQIVAALCVAALLLIVPAHALATWETRHRVAAGQRMLALAGMVLAGAIVLLTAPFDAMPWMVTFLVLAAHVVTVYAGLRIWARATPMSMAIIMLVLLAGLWLVPLLIEIIRWYFFVRSNQDIAVRDFTLISTFSPLGSLLGAWSNSPDGPVLWVGLVFQLGLAGLLMRLAARHNRPAAPVTAPPPQSAPS